MQEKTEGQEGSLTAALVFDASWKTPWALKKIVLVSSQISLFIG
jgi:hypothetical protein